MLFRSFFRFLGGIGIGASSVAAPTYISEISSPQRRGRLVALYQFNIVFGILVAFLSNYLLQGFGGDNDWRWMLGMLAIPAVVYTLLVPGLPESPRWLISKKNQEERARRIFQQIGVTDIDREIRQIREANGQLGEGISGASLLNRRYARVLGLAFFGVGMVHGWPFGHL